MLESVKKICSLIDGFEKIWFYCVDPGAFNIMLPVYDALKGNKQKVEWIFEGWSRNNNRDMVCLEWDAFELMHEDKHYDNACLVLGSQMDPDATQRAIRFCKDKGIFSVFCFDHWTNYAYHFLGRTGLFLPDRICVMDEVAGKSLIDELYPLLDDKNYMGNIEVVGHPAIERSVKIIQGMPEEKMRSIRNKVDARGKRIILFLLEPIENDFGLGPDGKPALGYTEYSILEYFFQKCELHGAKVIIKPHPRQDMEKMQQFLSQSIAQEFDYKFIHDEDLESLIAVADEVVGITTVALIIALKAGKEITSIQVGRNEKGKKNSNAYFESNLII